MAKTYWYGVYDSAYVCNNCECSMPMCADGDDISRHFKYCPFCGDEITAFYASKVDAEWLEEEKNEKHKSCFTCGHCCTDACPNIQYDACEQYWGYGIAEDCGLERVKCSKCFLNSGECDDCLFQNSKDCPEVNESADN